MPYNNKVEDCTVFEVGGVKRLICPQCIDHPQSRKPYRNDCKNLIHHPDGTTSQCCCYSDFHKLELSRADFIQNRIETAFKDVVPTLNFGLHKALTEKEWKVFRWIINSKINRIKTEIKETICE